MKKLKAALANGLLVLAATAAAVAVAEIAVRVAAPRATSTARADRYGLAMHYPSRTTYLPQFDQTVTINAAGMRDREHAVEKPVGTFRILILGDSFMEAYQVAFEASLPSLLEGLLNHGRDRKVEVINAGVSGWGTDDELRYLTSYGLEYDPDLVLVAVTLHNDVSDNLRQWWHTLRDDQLVEQDRDPIPLLEHATLRLKAFLAVRLHLVQVWREVRHRRESQAVGEALVSHVVQLFQTPTPERITTGFRLTEKLLERMQQVVDDRSGQVALMLIPLQVQLSDTAFGNFTRESEVAPGEMSLYQPQQLILAAAERLNLPVIDLLPHLRQWTAEHGQPLHIEWDGHWNEQGHLLAAQTVARELIQRDLVP